MFLCESKLTYKLTFSDIQNAENHLHVKFYTLDKNLEHYSYSTWLRQKLQMGEGLSFLQQSLNNIFRCCHIIKWKIETGW